MVNTPKVQGFCYVLTKKLADEFYIKVHVVYDFVMRYYASFCTAMSYPALTL